MKADQVLPSIWRYCTRDQDAVLASARYICFLTPPKSTRGPLLRMYCLKERLPKGFASGAFSPPQAERVTTCSLPIAMLQGKLLSIDEKALSVRSASLPADVASLHLAGNGGARRLRGPSWKPALGTLRRIQSQLGRYAQNRWQQASGRHASALPPERVQ